MGLSKIRTTAIAGLAAIAILSVGTRQAISSTFISADVSMLSRASEAVIQGRVVDVRSDWNDDHSMIFTHVTLHVTRTLKGIHRNAVIIRVPGGTVGDLTTVMVGAPRFTVKQEVVVFLAPWDDGVAGVMGYEQGLSEVRRDARGNARLGGGAADGLSLTELAGRLGRSGR